LSGVLDPVGAGLLAKAVCQPTCLSLIVYISIPAVTATYGFALTASHFFYKRLKKVTKKTLAPNVRRLAWARRSFAPAFIRGHRLRSASLRPPLDVFGYAERRCAPNPG